MRLRHAPLGAAGTATCAVPHRRLDTAYVVRGGGHRVHPPATTEVDVTGTG